MPVVELNLNRLQKLIGKNVNKKTIVDRLPFLGLDIESETKIDIRVEYSPNRPDYGTDVGIAIGMQGLLGVKKGIVKLDVKKKEIFEIKVDSSVAKLRPYVTGIIAKNGKIDEKMIKQLMDVQEDLHFGIGRKRKKSSIGIHDLDKISFPLRYTSAERSHSFVPLASNKNSTVSQILEKTQVGQDYGSILGNSKKVPIILDSKDNTVSFPPIINSALTTVTTKTKNLFVEVTSIEKNNAEDMLSVVATLLQSAGFNLYSMKISGHGNTTPQLKNRTINLDVNLVNQILGLELSPTTIVSSLKKCRLDAKVNGKKISCVVPRYRFDIFGPMDLVEEVALGYGIENLQPTLSPSDTLGEKHSISKQLNSLSLTMIGLGYMEALNSSLTSKRILFDLTNRNVKEIISVLDSKSQEHTILRDSLIPGLIENLSSNIHESYPQKLFETGIVFSKNNSLQEEIHFACVSANKDTNFSEIKSILQSALKTTFNLDCTTKTSTHSTFSKGRTAEVIVNKKTIGIVGEVDSKVVENFKIRVPVVGFEIKLELD